MLSPDERDTVAQATIALSDPLSVSIEGPRELKEGNQATYLLNINGGESTEDVSVTPLIALASEADLSDVSGLGARLTIPAGKASTSFTLVAHTGRGGRGRGAPDRGVLPTFREEAGAALPSPRTRPRRKY